MRTASISCADAFGPARTYAASPGMIFSVRNTTSDTPNRTMMDAVNRRTTNAVTRRAQKDESGAQPHVGECVRPGVRIHETLNLLVERLRLFRMQHVNARHIVIQDLFDLLVDLRGSRGIRRGARLDEQLFHLIVLIPTHVEPIGWLERFGIELFH